MSEPIKIVVTAQTAEAAAALQKFATDTGSSFRVVNSAIGSNRMALMELGHVGRSMADGLVAGISPLRMLAMETPRIGQACATMGIGLGTMLPVLAAVGAAAAVFGLEWYAVVGHIEDSTKKTEELNKELDKVPAILERIAAMQKAGLVSPAAGQEFTDYLNGRTKLYKDSKGNISPNKTETMDVASYAAPQAGTMGAGMGVASATTKRVTVTLEPIDAHSAKGQTDIQSWLEKQFPPVSGEQTKAAAKLKDELAKVNAEELTGIEKIKAENHDKYEKQREEIRLTAEQAGRLIGPKTYDAATTAAIEKLNQAEARDNWDAAKKIQDERTRQQEQSAGKIRAEEKQNAANDLRTIEDQITADQDKAGNRRGELIQQEYKLRTDAAARAHFSGETTEAEYTHLLQEAAHKRTESERQYNAELERTAQLKKQIEQFNAEAQLHAIAQNDLLTRNEKAQLSIPQWQKQIGHNNSDIATQEQIIGSNPADSDAALNALQKKNELLLQNQDIQGKIDDAQEADKFGYQMDRELTKLRDVGTLAQQTAAAFGNVWTSAGNSVSDAFSKMILGTQRMRDITRELYNAIVTDVVQSATHMAVSWIGTHVIMAGAEYAFYTLATALGWTHLASVTAAKLAELGIHVGAEETKTAMTISGATTRIAANAAEAGAGAAASQASIPYVGPILAIAAMGAIIAAVLALSGGFEQGGFTHGTRGEMAGIVHGEEYVFSAPAVDRIGVRNLEALHNGHAMPNSPGSPGSSPAGHQTSVYAFTDPRQMADHLEKNSDHEKWVVDVMTRNIHKFRS